MKMVDMKCFLTPPVANVLKKRRCRGIGNMGGGKFGNFPREMRESLLGNNAGPRIKKPYVVIIGIVIILAIVLTGAYYFVFKKKNDGLIPPNPLKSLPASASRLHIFSKAAVCADGPPCAEIGRNILNDGGSAVDAAIAAMVCNGIYNMQSMGLGGGFLMTIYSRKDRKAYTLNAREKAPLKAKQEMFKASPELSKHGGLSIGVPGELMGYYEAHKRFGRLPFAKLLEPSIQFCYKGHPITSHRVFSFSKNDIRNDSNLRSWFVNADGTFKKLGDQVVPSKLCDTLKILAEKGPLEFYTGQLAEIIAEDIQKIGGIITREDLAQYSAEWMDPVSTKLKDEETLYSIQPPASGVLLSFIFNILNNYNFTSDSISDDENTILTYHRIIEAFKYAYARRTELGDPHFVNISSLIKNLTDPEYGRQIRMKIRDNSTVNDPEYYGGVLYNKEQHGTAHISVLSEDGDAVSVTSSVNIYFGCGYTSERTGIILNSVIDDFSFPYFKNYFGLPGSPNNALEPGKRPISSMSPAIIVDKDDNVKFVVGGSGGSKITSSVAQVIMRVLWFGQNLKESVDMARIHHQLYPMTVEYEYGILEQHIKGLEKIGHVTTRSATGSSIVCAIFREVKKIFANADFRKGGEVYGIN